MVKVVVCALLAMTFIAGCSQKRDDLRSPCVGTAESPCGSKRSVNDWWLA